MSQAHPEGDLAAQIGHVILDGGPEPGGQTLDADDHLRLVRRAALAHEVSGELLQQAVTAARSGGQSWATLGQELGLSRQGAQQRFGGAGRRTGTADDSGPSAESAERPDERWLGPVTAVDELGELELAGQLGWHTVEAGMFRHRMVRTATRWEHRRVLWTRSTASYLTQGWQVGARAFPWLYLVRDTGLPVSDPS
ncbi:hypothetical protein [uncultured Serinicoccus sp.]|uniref:hypothetical protein n=1 Tax=uncultured Serinicoccus sp. TaxID=735514 RepID=UPI002626810C|nr:hypothetical protein [uncultured Serinicoccus sp.]